MQVAFADIEEDDKAIRELQVLSGAREFTPIARARMFIPTGLRLFRITSFIV